MSRAPSAFDRVRSQVVAFCPHCHEEQPFRPLHDVGRLPAELAEADGAVWLVRDCPRHGRVVTLYEEDAAILTELERWTSPTKGPTPDDPRNPDPPPRSYLRGLGARQRQHTCVLLEDTTERCNLRCPTCYSGASPSASATATVTDTLANVDRRIELEGGRLDVLMLSGGEPTIHPELYALLGGALRRNIVRVLLNTNGVRLARDDRLIAYLAEHRDRLEVYLQFDGFRASTHRHHRAVDLREVKLRTIERLSAAGVFMTLTMAAERGVNEDEIGDVVRYALDTPFVGGVCIQPVFGSGRTVGFDPLDRVTMTGVLRHLGPQTGGAVTLDDLIALPCSHPHCTGVGFLVRTEDGWRSLVSLIGREELHEHLDLVSNRLVDPGIVRQLRTLIGMSLVGLHSEQSSLTHPTLRHMYLRATRAGGLGVASLARMAALYARDRARLRTLMGERVKRITVKGFMDIHTTIEERLLLCCVHSGGVADGRPVAMPFCAAQTWPVLGAMKISRAQAVVAEAARSRPSSRIEISRMRNF
ncbi:MAG TPA: radical SAM protein [Actinomycetota bacterium]|nr:radical SAM protein [Actinomycetota bacterium]